MERKDPKSKLNDIDIGINLIEIALKKEISQTLFNMNTLNEDKSNYLAKKFKKTKKTSSSNKSYKNKLTN